jgi:hypothetical protein
MKTIAKFIDQKCIGYRKIGGGKVESVIEGIVRYSDYSAGTVYSTSWFDGNGNARMSDWKEEKPDGIYQAK